MTEKPDSLIVKDIVEKCRPILASHNPANQGAALADMLAMWLAGHPPTVRTEMLAMHVLATSRLIDVNARIMGTGETVTRQEQETVSPAYADCRLPGDCHCRRRGWPKPNRHECVIPSLNAMADQVGWKRPYPDVK